MKTSRRLLGIAGMVIAILAGNNLYAQRGVHAAQDIYDPYLNYDGTSGPVVLNGTTNSGSYNGEFMITDEVFPWYLTYWSNNLMSYKIETVSFPFEPMSTDVNNPVFPCWEVGGCGDGISNPANPAPRKFQMPDDLTSWDNMAQSVSGALNHSTTFSGPHDLVSVTFFSYNTNWAWSVRGAPLPHTVLKITLYLHCGPTINTDKIDSVSWVYDNTRGRMSNYPFLDQNYDPSSSAQAYDVVFFPELYTDLNGHSYSQPDNTSFNPGGLSTPNYFPLNEASQASCGGTFAVPVASDWYGSPSFYQSPPYALIGGSLRSSQGKTYAGYSIDGWGVWHIDPGENGIHHTYSINKAIDLTTINSAEKVIYNPSDVIVTTPYNAPLVLPTGYTFRTVHGKYPTQQDVNDMITNNNWTYADEREVPVTTHYTLTDDVNTSDDETQSYYRVQENCKIVVEPCVEIWDAVFVLEKNSIFEYDPDHTYGNFSIDTHNGGSVVIVHYDVDPACKTVCHDAGIYDIPGEILGDDQWTWDLSTISTIFPNSSPGVVRINTEFHIPSGQTLTIGAGVRLEFGEQGAMVVERNAKLIANGTATAPVVFTSACTDIWKGLEVWGDRNKSQLPISTTQQGKIILHYSVIENADDAITVAGPSWGYEGGIVQADNTVFKDNERDIQFISYHNLIPNTTTETSNVSFFKSCTFETTHISYDNTFLTQPGSRPLATVAHITMWDVKGVKIEGSAFRTANVTDFIPQNRGTGIYTEDASYVISSAAPNTFENLSDAIWAKNSSFGGGTVMVQGQTFTNNIHSVVMEGVQYGSVNLNHFTVPNSENFYGVGSNTFYRKDYNKPVGIYLNGCIDFSIQENDINVSGSVTPNPNYDASGDDCNYGMVIHNCIYDDYNNSGVIAGLGLVYLNSIYNVNVGLQAEGNNGDFNSPYNNLYGFDFKCNVFQDNNYFDFAMISGLSNQQYITSTIKDQGIPSPVAASDLTYNRFMTSGVVDHLYNSSGTPFLYHDGTGNPNPPVLIQNITYTSWSMADSKCLSNFDNGDGNRMTNYKNRFSEYSNLAGPYTVSINKAASDSERDSLKNLRSGLESVSDHALVGLIQQCIVNNNPEEGIAMLRQNPSKTNLERLASLQMIFGQYREAKETIRMLDTETGITTPLTFMMGCHIDLLLDGKTWKDAGSNLISEVFRIYSDSPEMQVGARTILSRRKMISYINEPMPVPQKQGQVVVKQATINESVSLISIYPNPANEKVNISLVRVSSGGASVLQLVSAYGQVLQTIPVLAGNENYQIDLAQYDAGLYFVRLMEDGRSVDSKRLSITK